VPASIFDPVLETHTVDKLTLMYLGFYVVLDFYKSIVRVCCLCGLWSERQQYKCLGSCWWLW